MSKHGISVCICFSYYASANEQMSVYPYFERPNLETKNGRCYNRSFNTSHVCQLCVLATVKLPVRHRIPKVVFLIDSAHTKP
ncbi:hypothetical protein LX36DRAFT_58637 [Colletotrichum falcatum]|nr:hypothetical protein LX36DRAFT_58637 [Colletotrichum falcatum]